MKKNNFKARSLWKILNSTNVAENDRIDIYVSDNDINTIESGTIGRFCSFRMSDSIMSNFYYFNPIRKYILLSVEVNIMDLTTDEAAEPGRIISILEV